MIKINTLQYKWPNQQEWLLNIKEFDLTKGSKLFIKGASGSGKTTLLNLLGGVLLPHNGEISILGTDITKLKSSQRDRFRANHMGYIFQQFNLVPYLSVLDNVTLPCWFSKERLLRSIKDSGSPEKEAVRLLKYLGLNKEEDIYKKVIELSVGQQQRVAAARALIGSPELLIADEPTSSLDEDMQQTFVKLLFNECERKATTLIYVSHDTRLKGMFDQVYNLHDQKLISVLMKEGAEA